MKKVLIISYYFPPSGGPGVQRVLKFVKYLPEFGWEPIVLTVKDGDFPARDESLLDEVPKDIKVYRTKIFEPYKYYRKLTGRKKDTALDVDNINMEVEKNLSEKISGLIRATFFIPDGRRGWLRHAVSEGKKIIEKENPDVIFSSSPPYTCALIAMKLKKYAEKNINKKIVWVSDFRDAWTEYLTTPDRWFIPSYIDKNYEKKTLEAADALTIIANGFKDDFDRKYPEISSKKKYVLIRNGFDTDDYSGIKFDKSDESDKSDKFTVVYTGSMYGKRNPYFFINTLSDLSAKGLIEGEKIKLIFVGRCSTEISNYIDKCPMKNSVVLISYVPHSESIKYLINADMMLLLIDEDKYSKMILSGKVFEYLGASLITGKPIIAICPKDSYGATEGEASDLIKETSAGSVIPHNDKDYLSKEFLKYYNSPDNIEVNTEAIKQYERKLLTKKLSETFDRLIEGRN